MSDGSKPHDFKVHPLLWIRQSEGIYVLLCLVSKAIPDILILMAISDAYFEYWMSFHYFYCFTHLKMEVVHCTFFTRKGVNYHVNHFSCTTQQFKMFFSNWIYACNTSASQPKLPLFLLSSVCVISDVRLCGISLSPISVRCCFHDSRDNFCKNVPQDINAGLYFPPRSK